jgi:hypothetical protein
MISKVRGTEVSFSHIIWHRLVSEDFQHVFRLLCTCSLALATSKRFELLPPRTPTYVPFDPVANDQ